MASCNSLSLFRFILSLFLSSKLSMCAPVIFAPFGYRMFVCVQLKGPLKPTSACTHLNIDIYAKTRLHVHPTHVHTRASHTYTHIHIPSLSRPTHTHSFFCSLHFVVIEIFRGTLPWHCPPFLESFCFYINQDFLPTKPQLGTFGFAWAQGVVSPFISSKEDKMDAIFMAVGDLLTETAVVMDVGCGDGAFLLEVGGRFGCRCHGLEIDAALAELAREKAKERKVGHLTQIFEEDLFDVFSGSKGEEEDAGVEKEGRSESESLKEVAAAVRESTVFYFYLLPAVLDKLAPWLLCHMANAKPGHLAYIFNTWAPASQELARFLASPCDRATQSKRGFFVYQSS